MNPYAGDPFSVVSQHFAYGAGKGEVAAHVGGVATYVAILHGAGVKLAVGLARVSP
jgi:hypothetical protein